MEERDDYPIIPQPEGSEEAPKKEPIWNTFIEDYAFQVPYNGTNEFYDKNKLNDAKLKSSFQKAVDAHFKFMEKELASLKEEYNALVDKFTLAQEIGIHMQEAYNLMIYNGAQVPASVCSKVNHLRTQAQIKTKQLNELNKPFSDNK